MGNGLLVLLRRRPVELLLLTRGEKYMYCPICGGTIYVNESEDFGECDTCMTYYYEGRIYPDRDTTEEDIP